MARNRLSLFDREIMRVKELVSDSHNKLKELTGEHYVKEYQRFCNLSFQLRKITNIANKDVDTFYCSTCGDRFNTWKTRATHTQTVHGESE